MTCEICSKQNENEKIEIAHVKSVGMGRNRENISHVGDLVMILCHTHHQVFQHTMGIEIFMQRYQLKGIEVMPDVDRRLKLGRSVTTDDN